MIEMAAWMPERPVHDFEIIVIDSGSSVQSFGNIRDQGIGQRCHRRYISVV